jgi:glycerophosphoryl diester phosphodiesterase
MPSINFKPPFIAHRGASRYAPENTLAAFLKAKELGAKWVEFDVMLTACGEAVIMHDETLDRTTNGSGYVGAQSYETIRTLDAGSWFSPAFSQEKIPTLRETIAFLRTHQLAANVEIKTLRGDEERTVKKVLADIQAGWAEDMTPPLISSFSLVALHYVRACSPQAMIGLLVDSWFPGWEDLVEKLQCATVDVNQAIVTPREIAVIKAMGKLVLAYTVNDVARAKELIAMGVSAIFTDDVVGMASLEERIIF